MTFLMTLPTTPSSPLTLLLPQKKPNLPTPPVAGSPSKARPQLAAAAIVALFGVTRFSPLAAADFCPAVLQAVSQTSGASSSSVSSSSDWSSSPTVAAALAMEDAESCCGLKTTPPLCAAGQLVILSVGTPPCPERYNRYQCWWEQHASDSPDPLQLTPLCEKSTSLSPDAKRQRNSVQPSSPLETVRPDKPSSAATLHSAFWSTEQKPAVFAALPHKPSQPAEGAGGGGGGIAKPEALLGELHRQIAQATALETSFPVQRDFQEAHGKALEIFRGMRQPQETYFVNFGFLAGDPTLTFQRAGLEQLFPQPLAKNRLARMRSNLQRSLQSEQALGHLKTIFHNLNLLLEDSTLNYQTGRLERLPLETRKARRHLRQVLQKRIKRLYDYANQLRQSGLSGKTWDNPVEELAENLSENAFRCMDGLSDGLAAIEARMLGNSEKPAHAGEWISKVFATYRRQFIQRHQKLAPLSPEFQTTVVQVLTQRLLFSLSLNQPPTQILYPSLASPHHPGLQPAAVMERFLRGGDLRLSRDPQHPTLSFEGFDITKMLSLLYQARARSFLNASGTKKLRTSNTFDAESGIQEVSLSNEFLEQICFSDPQLQEQYVAFFTDWDAPNAYFAKPEATHYPSNYRVKDAFWLYLLEKYEYILRVEAPAAS